MLISAALFLTFSTALSASEILISGSETLYATQIFDVARRGNRDYLVSWSKEGVQILRRLDGKSLVPVVFPPGTWIGSRFIVRDGKVLLRTYHADRGQTLTDCDTATNVPDQETKQDTSSLKYKAFQKGLLALDPDISMDTYDPLIGHGGYPASKEVRIAAFDMDDPPANQPPYSISQNLKVMAWGGSNLDFGYLKNAEWKWQSALSGAKAKLPPKAVVESVPSVLVTEKTVHFGVILKHGAGVSWKTVTVSAPWNKPNYRVRDGLVCRELGG